MSEVRAEAVSSDHQAHATVTPDSQGGTSIAFADENDAAAPSLNNQSRARQQAVLAWLQKLPYASLVSQFARFGLVGVIAAAIHFSIVVTLVQTYALEPLIANVFAFTVSFQVSYFGHRRFTFAGTSALHSVAFPKLLSLQLVNFVANESLFYFFLSLHLPYQLALILVLGTLPLFTFVVSKWWVFKR